MNVIFLPFRVIIGFCEEYMSYILVICCTIIEYKPFHTHCLFLFSIFSVIYLYYLYCPFLVSYTPISLRVLLVLDYFGNCVCQCQWQDY